MGEYAYKGTTIRQDRKPQRASASCFASGFSSVRQIALQKYWRKAQQTDLR